MVGTDASTSFMGLFQACQRAARRGMCAGPAQGYRKPDLQTLRSLRVDSDLGEELEDALRALASAASSEGPGAAWAMADTASSPGHGEQGLTHGWESSSGWALKAQRATDEDGVGQRHPVQALRPPSPTRETRPTKRNADLSTGVSQF